MTRFSLDQLQTFLAVTRLGGVRRAAVALNITQPAVTARIKNLEDALACPLFERTSGGMKLTKRGELLLAHAERFEHLTELVQRDVVDPSGAEGRLRLGASETIAECWLPDLVSRLYAKFPKLEIELLVDVSQSLRSSLLDREIDVAILLGPISEYSVDNVALPGFDLAWYAARDTDDVAPESLLRRPVMTYARNTRPFREVKEQLFEHVGPEVSLIPSSSLSASFRMGEADRGVAALPRALGDQRVRDGRIREFDPGWVPSPLQFTASYLKEPKSYLAETAAYMAHEVAETFQKR